MNRKICNIIIFFAFFAANFSLLAQAEYPKVIKNYIKLNENVKIIKDSKIMLKTEVISINGRDDTVRQTSFDPDGYIINEIIKVDTSKEKMGEYITRKYSYIYNNFKLLTEKFDSSGAVPKKFYMKYDEFYNVTDEETFVQNKRVQQNSYEYDDLSRLSEATLKDLVNDCKVIETYDYDSYNNLVRITVKNKCITGEDKPIETKFNYTYDKDYRILEKKTNASSGEYKTETFTYTADGKPESSYEITGKDSYISKKYTYDKNNIRIKKTEVNGELSSASDILIKLDKNGNRLEEQYFDTEGKLLYTYKFLYTYY